MINFYNKLFLSPYFFTIALRHKAEKSILSDASFDAEFVIPASRLHWVADPVLIDYKGETYLFYEAFHKNKGRLEVVQVNSDCTVSKPSVILEGDCHFSYPFVFKVENRWYMIPESSELNKVTLYQSISFPTEWEKKQDLFEEHTVDTTVFEYAGKWYLLTFVLQEGTERVTPKAYIIKEKDGDIELNPLLWTEFDELRCRGAGPLFKDCEGNLIRPAQASLDNRYGDQIVYYRVNPNESNYSEDICGQLQPQNVFAKKWWLDGLHTYTTSDHFEAIDIRCRKFDLLKVPRTIIKRFLHIN